MGFLFLRKRVFLPPSPHKPMAPLPNAATLAKDGEAKLSVRDVKVLWKTESEPFSQNWPCAKRRMDCARMKEKHRNKKLAPGNCARGWGDGK